MGLADSASKAAAALQQLAVAQTQTAVTHALDLADAVERGQADTLLDRLADRLKSRLK